jgi:hypothetical protein
MQGDDQTVGGLLHSLGLGKYSITFQAEEVDMAALRHMTDNDLKELGVPMVSISPTSCTKGISVDRAGFLGQCPHIWSCFVSCPQFFLQSCNPSSRTVLIFFLLLSLCATSFSCCSVSFALVPLSEYI